MTADPWNGPACAACRGQGQITYTRGNHWTSIACTGCHGTGLADAPPPSPRYRPDGSRIPEDGEAYDEAVHGKPGPAYALSSDLGCRTCYGAGVVVSASLVEAPCPACSDSQ